MRVSFRHQEVAMLLDGMPSAKKKKIEKIKEVEGMQRIVT